MRDGCLIGRGPVRSPSAVVLDRTLYHGAPEFCGVSQLLLISLLRMSLLSITGKFEHLSTVVAESGNLRESFSLASPL